MYMYIIHIDYIQTNYLCNQALLKLALSSEGLQILGQLFVISAINLLSILLMFL